MGSDPIGPTAHPSPLERGQHFLAQDGVDAGLVALALAAQLQQHVGDEAQGGRGPGRPADRVAHGFLPGCIVLGRDVAVVDGEVRPGREPLELDFLRLRQWRQLRQIDVVLNSLPAHGVATTHHPDVTADRYPARCRWQGP